MTPTALFADQQICLEQCLTTLEAEKECLSAGLIDGKRLAALAALKQEQLDRLDQLEMQRRGQQKAQGFGEGRQGADKFSQAHGTVSQWQRIFQLAQQVRQINRLNGFIISQRLAHNQRAIDFLDRAIGGNVYGPNGQSRHSRHSGFGGISSKA